MSNVEPNGSKALRLDPCWPVLPGPRYRGLVWNHHKLKDGTLITTSAVKELRAGSIVTHSGSVYELGRTFYSEEHAAEQIGLRGAAAKPPQPQTRPVEVIDLETDDLAALGTFAHEHIPTSGS